MTVVDQEAGVQRDLATGGPGELVAQLNSRLERFGQALDRQARAAEVNGKPAGT